MDTSDSECDVSPPPKTPEGPKAEAGKATAGRGPGRGRGGRGRGRGRAAAATPSDTKQKGLEFFGFFERKPASTAAAETETPSEAVPDNPKGSSAATETDNKEATETTEAVEAETSSAAVEKTASVEEIERPSGGRGRGRGGRGRTQPGRGRGRGRAAKESKELKAVDDDESDDDSSAESAADSTEEPATGAGRGRGRGGAGRGRGRGRGRETTAGRGKAKATPSKAAPKKASKIEYKDASEEDSSDHDMDVSDGSSFSASQQSSGEEEDDDESLSVTDDDDESEDSEDSEASGGKRQTKKGKKTPAKATPSKAKAAAAKKTTTPKTKRPYEKRKHPSDQSLLFNRNKYERAKEAWLNSALDNAEATEFEKEIVLFEKSMSEKLVLPLESYSLHNWLAARDIDPYELEPLILKDVQEDNEIKLRAFEGSFWPSTNPRANKENPLDLFLNSAGPVQVVSFDHHDKQSPSEKSSFNVLVGCTRVGWPSAEGDYEVRDVNASQELLRKTLNIPEERPFPTISNRFGMCTDYPRLQAFRETHDNLLQVWHVEENTVKLAYFVSLEAFGAVQSLAWNPNLLCEDENLSGIVAVLGSSGLVRVLLLPKSAPPAPAINVTDPELDFLALPVIDVASVEICKIFDHDEPMITSMAWVCKGYGDLCCGMSDGSITIWTINNCLFEEANEPILLFSLADSTVDGRMPASHAVTALASCPYAPHLLLAGNGGGYLKVWDLRDSVVPVYTRKIPGTSGIMSASWDIPGYGCYYTDYEDSHMVWDGLWECEVLGAARVRGQMYAHSYLQGNIRHVTSMCDEHSLVASCSTDGTVRAGFTTLLAALRPPGQGLMELFNVISVERSTPDASSSSSAPPSGTMVMSVDRKLRSAQSDKPEMIALCNEFGVRLHAIDVMLRGDKKNIRHAFAYGGESGIVRVHDFDIVKSLLALPLS